MEPNPIFSYFDRGMRAMRDGNFKAARDLFAKEVDRTPYYHEFHFWLANAYFALGDVDRARRELALALEYSTTRREHDVMQRSSIGSSQQAPVAAVSRHRQSSDDGPRFVHRGPAGKWSPRRPAARAILSARRRPGSPS